MLFRSTDLLGDFERLTKGLNLGPDFDKTIEDVSTAFSGAFSGASNVDVLRSEDKFELFIDLPGIAPESVELTVDGRTLTVSANRDFNPAEAQEFVHAGRRHGAFSRSFRLTDDLDAEALTARSEHGVLVVSVPVIAAVKPRKIEITS